MKGFNTLLIAHNAHMERSGLVGHLVLEIPGAQTVAFTALLIFPAFSRDQVPAAALRACILGLERPSRTC